MPVTARTIVQYLWQDSQIDSRFRAGVSLHSHTQFSEEGLAAFAGYVRKSPFSRYLLGIGVDYERAFYNPPLTPRQAYRLEEKQIQRRLQLPALVSLTDHDKIDGNKMLHLLDRYRKAPISTEWTVPFGPSFFHLGIHNLPPARADFAMQAMAEFTAAPNDARLPDVLRALAEDPSVLVVVNHPLWDEKGIGKKEHRELLGRLLAQRGSLVHALEVNGLRSLAENCEVLKIGDRLGIPVVAGGDRHGREPNAILNLSAAASFSGFVEEVRKERISHVVFMPQYQTARGIRITRMVVDSLREYPENVHAKRTWKERMHYRPIGSTEAVPLCSAFAGERIPLALRVVETAVKLLRTGAVRNVVRLATPESTRA